MGSAIPELYLCLLGMQRDRVDLTAEHTVLACVCFTGYPPDRETGEIKREI
jgi:hypothetical protein